MKIFTPKLHNRAERFSIFIVSMAILTNHSDSTLMGMLSHNLIKSVDENVIRHIHAVTKRKNVASDSTVGFSFLFPSLSPLKVTERVGRKSF